MVPAGSLPPTAPWALPRGLPQEFPNGGTTNGAAWYPIYGSMQVGAGCRLGMGGCLHAGRPDLQSTAEKVLGGWHAACSIAVQTAHLPTSPKSPNFLPPSLPQDWNYIVERCFEITLELRCGFCHCWSMLGST